MATKSLLLASMLLIASGSTAQAQQAPASPADSALNACIAAVEAKNEKEADAQADRANKLYDQIIAGGGKVADAYAGKARVISQCRIPFAAMMRKGALVEDSNELLKHALAIDSLNFGARFTLAMNHYHTPAFLGRTDDAIRELEKLIQLFGSSDIPLMASVRRMLDELYKRTGRKAPEAALPVYDLEPLMVEAGKFSVDDTRGAASLKRMDIVTMPGGTADVLQVFQAMPGVTRATEGSDLYVRGGDPAEAPVFVDGARMTYAGAFETLHGGMFGVLDPNSIKKADFSSGGFSARYGNALSGILDITSEGRPSKSSWRAGANLVSGGATFRTPLGANAGLWATGKATETTALLWTQGKGDLYPKKPWSVNGMAGVAFAPTANVEIKATMLTETDAATRTVDVLGYTGPLRSAGGTHMGLLSARVLNDAGTASLRGTVSAARRSTTFEVGVLDRDRNDDMYTVRIDGDLTPGSTVRLRAGVEGASLKAGESGTVPTSAELAPGSPSRSIGDLSTNASHIGGYVESEINITSNLGFIAGTRADRLPATDSWSVDPRVALAYRTNGWTLRTGAGLFHQGAWRSGYKTPNPGTPSNVATRARHLVFGIERETPIFFRVEAFAKSYDDYTKAAGTTSPDLFVQGPAIDRGQTYGIDGLMRWKASGALSGWASYSYLNGKVRLRDAQEWIPSATDVHHTFTGVAKLAFSDNWEIGTTVRLATGKPFTPMLGQGVYAPTHSERMPNYARLDTRLTRLVPTSKGMLVFYVEGLNLLDRKNVMAYTYDSSYARRIPVESFFANRTLVFGAEVMF